MAFSSSEPAPSPGPTQCPSKWWVSGPYPATVRGVDVAGDAFTQAAEVEGMSASDLILRLWPRLAVETHLLVVVRIGPTPHTQPMHIALTGRVWRIESCGERNYCVAMAIKHHRFL